MILRFISLARFSGRDAATARANYCDPVKARPQHRELRSLLFPNSVWGFFKVPQLFLQQGLWSGTSGLLSLPEKTWKCKHLLLQLQRKHFLLSYLSYWATGFLCMFPLSVSDVGCWLCQLGVNHKSESKSDSYQFMYWSGSHWSSCFGFHWHENIFRYSMTGAVQILVFSDKL